MAIRRWGTTWRSQVMYSLLVNLVEQPESVESTERKYTTFLTHLRALSLLEAHTLKPLLDGKALAKALSTPPGPWMKDALDVVMAWQLRHPDVKDPAQAIEAVKLHQQQDEGGDEGDGRADGSGELSSALVQHFLQLTIRPLFAQARPDSVTEHGRKKISSNNPQPKASGAQDETVTKPWKNARDAYALDLLRWSVHALTPGRAERFWPLLMPPILTLLDDWEVQHKRIGAELLHTLLKVTPPALLKRTGLGPIFEEALAPTLTFLPPLTPEHDAVELLEVVLPTLLTLIDTRFPPSPAPQSSDTSPTPTPNTMTPLLDPSRIQALDTHLRTALLHPLSHISPTQHPRLNTTLLSHVFPVLSALGIDSVKHLKYLLPLLRDVLANPLLLETGQVELLAAANKAMQAVVLKCWPRMVGWRGEVFKGLIGCWNGILEKEGKGMEELRQGVRETVQMLKAAVAVSKSMEWEKEVQQLIEADGRLDGLLK